MSDRKNLGQPDPNVQMPAAIRAAALRSAELHKQAYGETTIGTPAEPAPTPAPEAATAPAEPTQEPAPAAPAASGEQNWEHSYKSLKGRYDAQSTTISSLNNQVEALKRELAAKPAPQTPANPDLTFKNITPEDREAYGEDFLDVAARAAQERLNPTIASIERQLAELKGTVTTTAVTTAQQAQDNMYATLTTKMPNWRDINKSSDFLAWVNLPDPYSGVIRVNMMREAHANNDAERVLNFFKGFLADEAAMAPASANEPEKPKPGKVPLENFAAPGRAKAPAATQAPGEKETISTRQIAQFYLDVNKGHYRGNEAEKDRLEAMIFAAQAEGRVTP